MLIVTLLVIAQKQNPTPPPKKINPDSINKGINKEIVTFSYNGTPSNEEMSALEL